MQGSAFALHGQETVAALFGFDVGLDVTNNGAGDYPATLDLENNWVWFAIRAGVFAWTVYEVIDAADNLLEDMDRVLSDGVITADEAADIQRAAAAAGITVAIEMTAGKVVKGLRIVEVAGDFSVSTAKALGLDDKLAKLNDKFRTFAGSESGSVGSGAPNNGAGGFYDPRAWRKNYDDFYNGNVTSTTVPPFSAKNVRFAGQSHPKTGVVFDQRGFPIFDNHTAYDTRFIGTDFSNASYQTQMRMATRDLRTTLDTNPQLRSQFRPDQLQAIQSGNSKIPDYTWHHHQDSGRMQLVDQTVHKETGHIGGEAISGGQ